MAASAQLALFEPAARALAPVARRVLPTPSSSSVAQPSLRRSQAWLALHLSRLSLAAAYRAASAERRATLDASAWAIVGDDRLKHVVACNDSAFKDGVRPGHRMNAAIALCSSLELLSRDISAERLLLEHIADTCLNYTSAVSVQPPNEVLLEVRGSLRLFGGPAALAERVQTDLAPLGLGLQLSIAPTARSAQWMARASTMPRICFPRELGQALAYLPLSILQWPLPIELQLTRFGVTSVGDLMRLSRKDLARRIGQASVLELQQALGRTRWLHHGWSTPLSYHDRVLLDFEIETTRLLERVLERPLARLGQSLIAGSRAIDELTLTLKHREGSTRLPLRLHQPTADVAHLATLLHEHLDRLFLQAPICEVLIDAPRLLRASPRNQALALSPNRREQSTEISELKARLLEQLQSRFGAHSVQALAVRPEHVPERAQGRQCPSICIDATQVPAGLPKRPLWLLREPKSILAEVQRGLFRFESSPETIEAEAWSSASVRRAYYRARRQDGSQCWLFRDLSLPRHWFLHGLFG